MKRLTLLASALLVTVGTFASNGDKKVKEKEESQTRVAIMQGREIMKLVYLNEAEDKVKVSIYDVEGKRLASKSIKSEDGFIQPFNFTQLEEGDYTFEITDNAGTIVENISFDRSEVKMSSVYKIKGSNKYRLNVLSEGLDVSVKILDEDLNVIHTEKFVDAESFSRIYELPEGTKAGYYFSISTNLQEDVHYAKF